MQKRLSFMVSEELFERIELARGDVARERWLRRAVERALGSTGADDADPPRVSSPAPAPAEQPEADGVPFAPVGARLRETRPSRPFSPYPKGGKR